MRKSRPLFVFEGTGGTTPYVADLVRLGTRLHHSAGRMQSVSASSTRLTNHPAIAAFMEKTKTSHEVEEGPGQSSKSAVERARCDARLLALNFPERFNPESVMIVDVSAELADFDNGRSSAFHIEQLQACF